MHRFVNDFLDPLVTRDQRFLTPVMPAAVVSVEFLTNLLKQSLALVIRRSNQRKFAARYWRLKLSGRSQRKYFAKARQFFFNGRGQAPVFARRRLLDCVQNRLAQLGNSRALPGDYRNDRDTQALCSFADRSAYRCAQPDRPWSGHHNAASRFKQLGNQVKIAHEIRSICGNDDHFRISQFSAPQHDVPGDLLIERGRLKAIQARQIQQPDRN